MIVLDEIGRTSTYDGLALAWAVVEHDERIKAKTLFATHYQADELGGQLRGRNLHVAVKIERRNHLPA
ncbi:MAG: hypothetical protein WKF37_01280 [Bryobacteraceae bacterium]